jgi:hypothetical protein
LLTGLASPGIFINIIKTNNPYILSIMKIRYQLLLALVLSSLTFVTQAQTNQVWSKAKANAWYAQYKWMSGADFIPSTAINQLEMWQADTFDPVTIDRELGWAQGIGFNTMRVFLHSVAWKEDPQGFKKRVNQYLAIADKHHIKTIFVFLDDCWNADPKPGKQPSPKPGIHNSGWMQDPGNAVKNLGEIAILHTYVTDVLTTFKHDKRVLLWDLFNEPNAERNDTTMMLLTHMFTWAHAVRPDQPLSVCVWDFDQKQMNAYQIANSDVITYHSYDVPSGQLASINELRKFGRPIICTEYMARPRNSTFENTMPLLKKEHVGAINWGLVTGKTNTKYAWDTPIPDGSEPKLWFHDVFRQDGTPYKQDEVDLIKKLNGVK